VPRENFKLFEKPEDTLRQWARVLNFLFDKNLDNNNIASTTLTLGTDQIKASNIAWGVGSDEVDASDVPILDASSYFSGASVETALSQLGSTILNIPAENVKINDTGGYFNSTSVEGALQEISSTIRNIPAENVKINDTGGFYVSTSVEGTFQEIAGYINYSSGDVNIYSTGYMNITAKNLVLANTVFDDIRVPVTATRTGGSKDPGFSVMLTDGLGSQGVFTYHFDKNVQEELFFTLQIPHSYKTNTNLFPHVHWSPTSTGGGNVVWGLEYTLQHFGNGAFPNTNIIRGTGAAGVVAFTHNYTDLTTGISGSTGISSMLLGRIFRDSTNAADTYGADAALLEIDFHYEVDKLGTDYQTS
jgi:hypothetical protein